MSRDEMTLVFRCPRELVGVLPPPIPAVQGLPDWFKAMPQKSFNMITQQESQTVKRCPPFIDAMTYGFLIPLPCDLKVAHGEFSWDFDLPVNSVNNFWRSPISFHDASQVVGTPYHGDDRLLIKFNNFWTIEAPAGYSLLFTHPVNRPELPFVTLTGLVDSDLYTHNRVHFPAHWRDVNFNGVLPKGTPVAQCIPVKRDLWTMNIDVLSDEDAIRVRDLSRTISRETGIYRRRFRAGKR
ncbi:MAG: hypothetical protein IRY89_10815 [Pseudolabrys sp.]|nr:hypothetical protein [Pseudolabrys sp.]